MMIPQADQGHSRSVPKIALVCDDLIQQGGHEKVVLDFCEIYPDAKLFCIAATDKWKDILRKRNISFQTTFVDKIPFLKYLSRFYALFLVHIFGIESIKLDAYDIVISISARFAHGVNTKPNQLHICYMSTPGRMFWEIDNYFKKEFWGIFTFLIKPILAHIRKWDYMVSQRVDYFLCNSKTTQERIMRYYNRDAKIIYPCIDIKKFQEFSSIEKGDYFVVLTRLVPWKRVDLAVNACKRLNLHLKIIGSGPDLWRLKFLAAGSSTINFLGFIDERKKISILAGALALINTQYEDFGIAPLEAMACGTPVIAFGKGGVLETVYPGVTGEFFYEQTPQSLEKALLDFEPSKYSKANLLDQARRFDRSFFIRFVREYIDEVYCRD